ncbi:MAG: hypothetical protein Q9221_006551 [Calogaya cf. arnoldii]
MSVTVKLATHGAHSISQEYERSYIRTLHLLREACFAGRKGPQDFLKSSFDPQIVHSIGAASNGFVKGAIRAYSGNHHLRIRPEDVWFAVLSQLSLYINAHAEEFRGKFVSHEGKKAPELHLRTFAEDMGKLIFTNVVNAELRGWMMPAFTTTTPDDVMVASVLMMGRTQEFCDMNTTCTCGLPSVTLLGEKSDWNKIFKKIEKLKEYGEEPAKFHKVLHPVILRFVQSFDDPTSKETINFWQRMTDSLPGGGGLSYYRGWITAFCFWGAEGKTLWKSQTINGSISKLELDGVVYHMIESDDVPPGYTSVPVKAYRNGYAIWLRMMAGSVGMRYIGDDTIQPESGWWMFEDDGGKSEEPLETSELEEQMNKMMITDEIPIREHQDLRKQIENYKVSAAERQNRLFAERYKYGDRDID